MKKVFKKLLAIVIAVVLSLSVMPVAFAADDDIASGTAGEGINWVIDADGTLTISGEGEIVVGWYEPPWKEYNDSILNVVVEEGITKIPSTAFCYAENLETVSVPASVTDMDDGTTIFWDCYALEEINVDADNENYVSVDGIVFSKDMTTLCFYPANKSGETYTIPDSVTTVKSNAFQSNQALQTVVIPDTVTTLEEQVFYYANIKSVTIGSGIKTIPSNCFNNCDYLESIVIPDSVEAIGSSAFYSCNDLKTVTIGSGVKSIGITAFHYCDSLTAIHYTGTADDWAEIAIDEENEVLNSLPVHYITEDDYKEATSADCITDGHTEGLYCEECGNYLSGEVTESAWGHDFADGVCQREDCGYECEHTVNWEFDDKCDDCGEVIDLDYPEIKLGETGTAYIEKENTPVYVEFKPTDSGAYIITSDNGDNSDIDPYVRVYDGEFEEIDDNDDGGEGYNFELVFNANAGETYYIALYAYESDAQYAYTIQKHIAIDHQPTSAEPYVELTWDMDTEYQWYKVENGDFVEITDENGMELKASETVGDSTGKSSYDSETGWNSYYYEEYGYSYFFAVDLEEGDIVKVALSGEAEAVLLVNYSNEEYEYDAPDSDGTVTLTAPETGTYVVLAVCGSEVTAKAYVGQYEYTALEGETAARLANPEINSSYTCEITVDGKVLISDILEYTYAITHQPTEKELYVELNDDTDAKYQWYAVKTEYGEITDKDVAADSAYGSYDSERGWLVSDNGDFFDIYLEEGETIDFEFYGTAAEVSIWSEDEMVGEVVAIDGETDRTASITAPVSAVYTVSAISSGDAYVKVSANKSTYTALDGETAAKLASPVIGESYVCKVTFADDSTETSNVVKVTKIYESEDTDNNGTTNNGGAANNNADSGNGSNDTKSPNTGDNVSMILISLLLVAAICPVVIKCKMHN